MTAFDLLEYAAWGVSAALVVSLLYDMIRTDAAFPEDYLTSSTEGGSEHDPDAG